MADDNGLRRAREYLGLSREEVAAFLGERVDLVDAWEAGQAVPDASMTRLAGLYRRPAAYLAGTEPAPAVPEAVAALLKGARPSPVDRAEVEEFGRFLAHGPRPS